MKEAPLVEHLEELRARILRAVLAWAVMTGVAFAFRVQLLDWLRRPLDAAAARHGIQVNLIVLDIVEPFFVSLKVAAFGGLVLALPFIVYQVWAFIAPGLYEHEKRLAVPFLLGAGFSFALGALFAYLVLLPFVVPFLLGFLGDVVTPQISIGRYMGQMLMMMAALGLVFEMPVVSYLLARLGLLTADFLRRNWRVAIVLLLFVSALITPADVFSMVVVALPLFVLYWVSVMVAGVAERQRARLEGQEAA
ncbi:twin-arginine translocase subunit TatC [Thermus thermamylovorans]|uniref:Sec-independent protein translocase protein TatC n=1 Tax=Thermus thermamylovorans TaxID=2509362 RepID=A0A4V2IV65_9DEIN|nr:twin-arginine translocase subunit TatC [Thermus thermamylovorans]TBH21125.1 twin-arginine translocase subunit TatC [Thermus thermamylovorans]